jgi:16S rRNA (adenine(1408)-N(1))-methyltransferase
MSEASLNNYRKLIIDIGTGDGRFVYKQARMNPRNMYVGIDAALHQSKEFRRKINRERLHNVMFVEEAVENFEKNSKLRELKGKADEVYVNFPWGSLLGGIAKGEEPIVKNICGLVKDGGSLEIIFGYAEDAEPSEVERLDLKNIDEERILKEIAPEFEEHGLKLRAVESMQRESFFELDSSWAKKLTFGQERNMFKMVLKKR